MSRKKYTQFKYDLSKFDNEDESYEYVKLVYSNESSSKAAKKVMFVLDYVPKEDLESGRLLSGVTGDLLENILDAARKMYGQQQTAFNWLAVTHDVFRTRGKPAEFVAAAKEAFAERIKKLITRYKPDYVVAFGTRVMDSLIPDKIGVDDNGRKRYTYWMGVPVPREEDGHSYKLVSNLSLDGVVRGDSAEAYLLGFMCRNLSPIYGKWYHVDGEQLAKTKPVFVDTYAKFTALMDKVESIEGPVAVDTEARSLYRVTNKLYVVQFAYNKKVGFVIPIYHKDSPFTPRELEKIIARLKKFFEGNNKNAYHIYVNAKFDLTLLRASCGVGYFANDLFDIQGASFALDENKKFLQTVLGEGYYSLSNLAVQYGFEGYLTADFNKSDRKNFTAADLTDYGTQLYCAWDTTIPYAIHEVMIQEARDLKYTKFMAVTVGEISDTLHAFSVLEHQGALVDTNYLFHLRSDKSPIESVIRSMTDTLLGTEAAKRAAKKLSSKKGIQTESLWGSDYEGSIRLNLRKAEDKKLLFFDVLGLEPLDVGAVDKKTGLAAGKLDKKFQAHYKKVPEVAAYTALEKAKKLRNAYVKSFIRMLGDNADFQFDHRIRPHYGYLGVVTHRGSACLAGDTPVYVLDARGVIPMRDVRAGDWVWCFNNDLKPVPQKVSWAGQTKVSKTVTVNYRTTGSNKMKSVSCTEDHRFRLRDGSYKAAGELEPGDRVLALERGWDHEYRTVSYTGHRQFTTSRRHKERENRMVAKCCGLNPFHAHHKDEVKTNNVPSNLVVLHKSVHTSHHSAGSSNPMYYDLDPDWAEQVLIENGGRTTVFRDKYGLDYTQVMKKLDALGVPYKEIRKRCACRTGYITEEMLDEARRMSSYEKAAIFLKVGYYKAKELLQDDGNHFIVSVTRDKGVRKVYDLTVPKYHNFIANGVCVHNCDPNLQQVPSHSELGKHIKRLFIARPGTLYVKVDYKAHEVRGWGIVAFDKAIAQLFGGAKKLYDEYRLRPNKDLKKRLKTEADIHIMNAGYFFGMNVADVTADIRSAVKSVVFGVIYQKSAKSLARDLDKEVEFTEDLMSRMFKRFAAGKKWIDDTKKFARQHMYVEAPIGIRRRLWGYLLPKSHPEASRIYGEMDRRSVNSPIQGMCSKFMMNGVRVLSRAIYEIRKAREDFEFYINNSVHDSLENESGYKSIIKSIAVLEWSLTEGVKRVVKKRHGFDLISVPEVDFEIGASLSQAHSWDFSVSSLERLVMDSLIFQRNELKYDIDVDKVHDIVFDQVEPDGPAWMKQQVKNLDYKFDLTESKYIREIRNEGKEAVQSAEKILEDLGDVAEDDEDRMKAKKKAEEQRSEGEKMIERAKDLRIRYELNKQKGRK